jgi:ATP-binding cassette, subfamily B (MDR/TAP), member 1
MLVTGELTAGTILTVLFAVIIGAFSLGALGPRIEAFAKASAAAQKIFQTLQRIPTIDSLDQGGERFEGVKGEIDLRGVSFIYPARPEGTSPPVGPIHPCFFSNIAPSCFSKTSHFIPHKYYR